MLKRCKRCRLSLPKSAFRTGAKTCSDCNATKRQKYHADVERSRRRVYGYNLTRYGLTLEDYDVLLTAQGSGCALCGATESGRNRDGSPRRLHVDHDHETGDVRSLLCSRCNALVGWMEKSDAELIARAQRYLEEGTLRGYSVHLPESTPTSPRNRA